MYTSTQATSFILQYFFQSFLNHNRTIIQNKTLEFVLDKSETIENGKKINEKHPANPQFRHEKLFDYWSNPFFAMFLLHFRNITTIVQFFALSAKFYRMKRVQVGSIWWDYGSSGCRDTNWQFREVKNIMFWAHFYCHILFTKTYDSCNHIYYWDHQIVLEHCISM